MNIQSQSANKTSVTPSRPATQLSRREAFINAKVCPPPAEIAVESKRRPFGGLRKAQEEANSKLSSRLPADVRAVLGCSGRSIASSITFFDHDDTDDEDSVDSTPCDLDSPGPIDAVEDSSKCVDLKPFIPTRQQSINRLPLDFDDKDLPKSDQISSDGSQVSASNRSASRRGSDSPPTKPRRSCSFTSNLLIDDSIHSRAQAPDQKQERVPISMMHKSLPNLNYLPDAETDEA